ncbi:MAG: hypothetical protein NZ518_08075, partial [Dehalococcoidia bacterium]|nr:hypothetical protein [Dehalococcoidia bacterium]
IVSSELAARMIGMSLAARGSNIIGALVDASPRRQRSNYEAYGDVRGNCFGSLCYRRAWFVHGIAIQALAKRGDKTERAFVFGPVWMLQVDPFPVFDLAYGVLVRDGLGLSPGEPRWADLEKARKDAQGGEDKRREGMP